MLTAMDAPERLSARQYAVQKQVYREDVYFTLRWSPIAKAERININRAVPSVSGLAELYYMDDHQHLNLFYLARCFYGGLRSTIRAATDTDVETDERRRKILFDYEDRIYYRYTCIESQADMTDILFFFMKTYSPKLRQQEYSGRYNRIFLKEVDAGGLVTV